MSKRVTEVTLRITQSEDVNDDGWPETWDWPSIMDSNDDTHFELVRHRRLEGKQNMMFNVGIREVHVLTLEVEASSPEEAMEKAKKREGREVMVEYSHELDSDKWTVEEVE